MLDGYSTSCLFEASDADAGWPFLLCYFFRPVTLTLDIGDSVTALGDAALHPLESVCTHTYTSAGSDRIESAPAARIYPSATAAPGAAGTLAPPVGLEPIRVRPAAAVASPARAGPAASPSSRRYKAVQRMDRPTLPSASQVPRPAGPDLSMHHVDASPSYRLPTQPPARASSPTATADAAASVPAAPAEPSMAPPVCMSVRPAIPNPPPAEPSAGSGPTSGVCLSVCLSVRRLQLRAGRWLPIAVGRPVSGAGGRHAAAAANRTGCLSVELREPALR
jgi:hypothetical protein